MLAFVVENMFLLTIEILEGEAVNSQFRILRHPRLDGRQRNPKQLRVEPGAGLVQLREQDLHLLPFGVHLVVALILVVPQRGEVPDAVGQLSDVVGEAERGQQAVGALHQRALQGRKGSDFRIQGVVGRLPRGPVGKNVGERPFEPLGNRIAIPERRGRRSFGRPEQTHQKIIDEARDAGAPSHQYCFSSFFEVGHTVSSVSPSYSSPFFITYRIDVVL